MIFIYFFQFNVRVSDGRGRFATSFCTVDVTRNEEHPYFIGTPYSVQIDYNQAENVSIFQVTGNDNDKQVKVWQIAVKMSNLMSLWHFLPSKT